MEGLFDRIRRKCAGDIEDDDHTNTVCALTSMAFTANLAQKVSQEDALVEMLDSLIYLQGSTPTSFEKIFRILLDWGLTAHVVSKFSNKMESDFFMKIMTCSDNSTELGDTPDYGDFLIEILGEFKSFMKVPTYEQTPLISGMLSFPLMPTLFKTLPTNKLLPDFGKLYEEIFGHSLNVMTRSDVLESIDSSHQRRLSAILDQMFFITEEMKVMIQFNNEKALEKERKDNPTITLMEYWTSAYKHLVPTSLTEIEEISSTFVAALEEKDEFEKLTPYQKLVYNSLLLLLEVAVMNSFQIEGLNQIQSQLRGAIPRLVCTWGFLVYSNQLMERGYLDARDRDKDLFIHALYQSLKEEEVGLDMESEFGDYEIGMVVSNILESQIPILSEGIHRITNDDPLSRCKRKDTFTQEWKVIDYTSLMALFPRYLNREFSKDIFKFKDVEAECEATTKWLLRDTATRESKRAFKNKIKKSTYKEIQSKSKSVLPDSELWGFKSQSVTELELIDASNQQSLEIAIKNYCLWNFLSIKDCMFLGLAHCSTRFINEDVVFSGNVFWSPEYEGVTSLRMNIMKTIKMSIPATNKKQIMYGRNRYPDTPVLSLLMPPNPQILNRVIFAQEPDTPRSYMTSFRSYHSVKFVSGGIEVKLRPYTIGMNGSSSDSMIDSNHHYNDQNHKTYFVDLSTCMAALKHVSEKHFQWEIKTKSDEGFRDSWELMRQIIYSTLGNGDNPEFRNDFPRSEVDILSLAAIVFFCPRSEFSPMTAQDMGLQRKKIKDSLIKDIKTIGHQPGYAILISEHRRFLGGESEERERFTRPRMQSLEDTP